MLRIFALSLPSSATKQILVPSGDWEALTAAIVRLAGHRGERLALGAAGRLEAARRFSFERLVDDIGQLYQEALTEKRR